MIQKWQMISRGQNVCICIYATPWRQHSPPPFWEILFFPLIEQVFSPFSKQFDDTYKKMSIQ